MLRRTVLFVALIALGISSAALALSPASQLFVPAAARGQGKGTSVWVTDLYIFNPGTTSVNVDLYYLPRDTDNTSATKVSFTVQPGNTLVLPDVILNTFGLSGSQGGAFRIVSTGGEVLANCRIYNQATGGTFGQGLEGIPAGDAVTPGSPTDIVGLTDNGTLPGTFRTNIFATNTSTSQTVITFTLVSTSGTQLATRTYTLEPYAAFYAPIGDLGAGSFDNATLHVVVTSGSAVVVASKNDNTFSDGTTLEAWWKAGTAAATPDGTYYLEVYDNGTPNVVPEGPVGGGSMTVASGQVTSLLASYINFDKDDSPADGVADCPIVFELSTAADQNYVPVVTSAFSSGVTISNEYQYSDATLMGDIDWTITFTVSNNMSISGTVAAVGSNFTGQDAGCNGALQDGQNPPGPFLLYGGKAQ
ncbi:MAG: hypothetical protein LJE95_00165 [Acidobacteria bacterium]|nr:hypothetical protein [Acidobacteriota bacterium]